MTRLSDELSKRITPIDRILKLTWLALPFSLAMYIFIAYIHKPMTASQLNPIIILIFSLIGLIFTLVSLWLRYVLISPRAVAKYLNDKGPLWIYNSVHSAYKPSCKMMNDIPSNLDDMEKKMLDYAQKSLILQMMLWGMLNSTAIFGLVLSFLLPEPHIIIAFVIPVFIIALMQFPNIRKLLEAGLLEKNMQGQ